MSARARRASGSASIRSCRTRPLPRSSSSSKDVEARERIKAKIEKAVADGALPEARVRVDRFNFGPPVGFPVQFRVIGPDPNKVRDIAYQVRDVMRAEQERQGSRSSTGTSSRLTSSSSSTRTAPARSA